MQQMRTDELSVRDLFNTLWRGKILIISSFIIVMSITVLVVQQLVPKYTASSSVMINSRKLKVVDVDDVLSSMNLDSAIVQTEVEIIRSRHLLQRVINKIGVDNLNRLSRAPNYNQSGSENTFFKQVSAIISSLMGSVFGGADPSDATGATETSPENSPGFNKALTDLAKKGIQILDSVGMGDSQIAENLWAYVLEQSESSQTTIKSGGEARTSPSVEQQKKAGLSLPQLDNAVGKSTGKNKPDRSVFKLSKAAKEEQAISFLSNRLTVNNVGRSLVINITFTSENPELAAKLANVTAEQYLASQRFAKQDATQKANRWLNERIVSLRKKVLNAEKAIEAYRANAAAKQGGSNTVSLQQLSEVNSQVIIAQTKRSEAEARYRVATDLVNEGKSEGTAADVFESRTIVNLRKEETKLLGRASEAGARYEEAHPKMIKIRAEVASIQKRISREVRKIIEGLKNEVAVAKAREKSLRKSLEELQKRVTIQSKADVKLRELQREAKANRDIYEAFLGRFKEISNQSDIQEADARIISAATIPTFPSYPRKNVFYSLGAGVSLFFGLLLVFIRSRLDNRFKTPDQIEQIIGIPALGMIPFDKFVAKRESYAEVNIFDKSLFTEAIRSLHTSIFVHNPSEEGKVICVTSSLPSEGKTITTLSLARVAAMSGQRVLIIDCDLRRPSIHRAAKFNNAKGIVELLQGALSLEDSINVDEHSGAHMIGSKVYRGNPLDLLRSQNMVDLVAMLKNHYDLVLLDTPSILAVSDPKILSKLADQTLYLVKWDGVPKDAVLSGIKSLADLGTNFLGVTMTQVDLRKHQRYGYSNGGYYYGNYHDQTRKEAS
jgi:capsular exopolysaccharide synthesis family protein